MGRVELNDSFFNRLGFLPGVESVTREAATRALQRARSAAPVRTGEYQRGIVLERHDTAHRVVYRVVATARHSMVVESRTGTLARSVR